VPAGWKPMVVDLFEYYRVSAHVFSVLRAWYRVNYGTFPILYFCPGLFVFLRAFAPQCEPIPLLDYTLVLSILLCLGDHVRFFRKVHALVRLRSYKLLSGNF
jgi:hypothetical protein